MLDIQVVRKQPDLVRENIKKKFQEEKLPLVDAILQKDEEWRAIKGKIDALRAERNQISKKVAEAKKAGKNAEELLTEAKQIPEKIAEQETKATALRTAIDDILVKLPNLLHESVPIGKDDSQNVVREVLGSPRNFTFEVKNHAELMEALNIGDFDSAAEIAGNGFYILKGDLARLNQALISYARDFMVKNGYTYIEPPLMIRKKVLDGVYTKAEIDAMSYKVEGEDLYLIATSEHPTIGMFIDKHFTHKDLPIKLTAYSMCFRKEIGSHGVDEKGIFRTHQFNKQEMVVICHPDDSYKYYDELLQLSKDLFVSMKLPIRELESCSGDLSDLKAKGADLEAFSPRQQKYFEITSVTNMEAAQAQLLNIKFTDKDGERKHVHTLNNTAIATSRALVAILENNQQADGTVKIPDVLVPYMNGTTILEKQ